MSPVAHMVPEFDPPIFTGDFSGHVPSIILRRIVDNEYAHINVLLDEHASDALAEEMAVIVAGNNHINATHQALLRILNVDLLEVCANESRVRPLEHALECVARGNDPLRPPPPSGH